MEDFMPVSSPIQSEPQNNRVFKILSIEFVVFVLFVFIIIGVFNYFNIIQLGFLPHKAFQTVEKNEVVMEASPTVAISKKLIMTCPVTREACGSGKQIFDNEKFLGVGYTLPLNSKLYAVFGGTVAFGGREDMARKVMSHASITLSGIGDASGYTVLYEYFGFPKDTQSQKIVHIGDELGEVYSGTFPKDIFNEINFLVSVKDKNGGDVVIKPEDFVKN